MKIRLTENKLREIVNESIKELIDEGFLGDVWDNIKTGAQNDWHSFKNTFKGGDVGYINDVIYKYGYPLVNTDANSNNIFIRKTDAFGNRHIVGKNDYMDIKAKKLSFNPNGKIYKDLVSKYVDRNGQYLQGKNWKMLRSALIKYRSNRDALWEELLEMYGPGVFIQGGNNVNVG